MIGMFQSSRIASGSPRLQTSSAFSPSSASRMWKSRPSRIRLATFRMTLESSTTRHVLILASTSSQFRMGRLHCNSSSREYLLPTSCCQHIRCDFEDGVDIEDDHELPVEAMHAAGKLCHAGIEVDGVFFAAIVGEFQNLADLVDQQAVGFAAQIDAHRHRRLAVVVLRQAEAGAHVDHGDDAAAQVEQAGDLTG